MLWNVSLWALRKKEHRIKTIRKSVIEEKIFVLDFTNHSVFVRGSKSCPILSHTACFDDCLANRLLF
jgi:hypothetical protein